MLATILIASLGKSSGPHFGRSLSRARPRPDAILGWGVAPRHKPDCRIGVYSNLVNIIPRDVRRVLGAARVTFPAVTVSTTLGCACRTGRSGALHQRRRSRSGMGEKHAVPQPRAGPRPAPAATTGRPTK